MLRTAWWTDVDLARAEMRFWPGADEGAQSARHRRSPIGLASHATLLKELRALAGNSPRHLFPNVRRSLPMRWRAARSAVCLCSRRGAGCARQSSARTASGRPRQTILRARRRIKLRRPRIDQSCSHPTVTGTSRRSYDHSREWNCGARCRRLGRHDRHRLGIATGTGLDRCWREL